MSEEKKKIPIKPGNGCLFKKKRKEGEDTKFGGYIHLPEIPIPYPIIMVDDEGNEHEIPAGITLKGPEDTGEVVTLYIQATLKDKGDGKQIIVLNSPNFRTHDPSR